MTVQSSTAALPTPKKWQVTEPPTEFRARTLPFIPCEDVPQCPVCGDRAHDTFAVGFDYELMTCSNPWRFVRCAVCQNVWLNPRPALSTLPVIYPASYYAYNYEASVHPYALRGKQLLDELKMRSITKRLCRKPSSYLDVGCGNGRFLRILDRQGVPRSRLYGLELDLQVVQRLASEGYRVSCERVEHCESIPEAQIDLITMFHVIEHVHDPAAVLRKLAGWLTSGGVLALETPNRDSLDARMFQSGLWGGYHIPRHWHIFTPEGIQRLLDQAGLEIIDVRYQPGHSFWLYSFHHALRYSRHPRPRLARWFNPFGGLLPLLMFFTGLDMFRAAFRSRTSSMLILARRRASGRAV
jgi:SAM-dependent methyltransferase